MRTFKYQKWASSLAKLSPGRARFKQSEWREDPGVNGGRNCTKSSTLPPIEMAASNTPASFSETIASYSERRALSSTDGAGVVPKFSCLSTRARRSYASSIRSEAWVMACSSLFFPFTVEESAERWVLSSLASMCRREDGETMLFASQETRARGISSRTTWLDYVETALSDLRFKVSLVAFIHIDPELVGAPRCR